MPNRTLLIAGNWKMNNDVAEAAKLADELAQALPEVPAGVEVLVCPPTIDITTVHDRIQAAPIAAPTNPSSEIGVSITRTSTVSPKRKLRPVRSPAKR